MTETLVHLLESIVQKFPNREAVVHGNRRVTFCQLWSDVSSVAAFLRGHGLKRGDRVGILMENRPEYIATYYGILAAGGAAVGLNSETKARSLVTCLNHCGASWLFANGRHRELNKIIEQTSGRLRLVVTDDGPPTITRHITQRWAELVMEDPSPISLSIVDDTNQLAAIIYTSGTTGDPKGVMLSHGNLVANVTSIIEYLGLDDRDSIANVLPFFYSYGNSVMHTHLAVGAKLVLENSMVFPRKVLERMVEEKVTGFSGVPSTFALLLNRTKLTDFDLSAVRYMTQAGGPMPPANVDRFTKELPHVDFFVMYGQTEATARISYLPPEKLVEKLGSCGIPIPGVEIEVRDKTGKVTQPGTTGEIFVRGDNVMLGYWNNPQQTTKVLHSGWLKTNDLAHRDSDGFIFINGRASEMIKSGAHRISPQEIEEIITEIDGVVEVAVCGVPDDLLGQVIKAVIVPAAGVDIDRLSVQRYCMENLARYKVPKLVELVERLPKTASGKIKRNLLV